MNLTPHFTFKINECFKVFVLNSVGSILYNVHRVKKKEKECSTVCLFF